MKTKNIICSLLAVGLLAGCTTCNDKDESKLEAQAKITRADAEKTALAKAPNGTIKSGEIEQEDGKLIWSFDITTPDSKDITEVAVDANTGAVLSVAKESPEEQAKEAAEDKKKDKD